MTTPSTLTENIQISSELSPGSQLAKVREKQGLSQEYVASKLYLRVHIIELLETDQYDALPEPVFIKGYLRAYAKLLNIPYEPFLDYFNSLTIADRKVEKALWQGQRNSDLRGKWVRWGSLVAVFSLIMMAAFYWQRSATLPVISKKDDSLVKTTTAEPKKIEELMTVSTLDSMFVETGSEKKSG